MQDIISAICFVMVLGVLAQWVAWRVKIPAIILLFFVGLTVGPLTGYFQPTEIFSDLLRPFISIAIAIILFEGGLNLKFQELRETRKAVRRMVMGAPVSWFFTAIAAHYVAGLSWEVSVLLGGIMVVTGPTVIMPLLKQARLNMRVGSVLKWEGIVNDPIGALFAVLAFEYFTVFKEAGSTFSHVSFFFGHTLIVVLASYALAKLIAWVFVRGFVPEFLKIPVILSAVIASYVIANQLQEEAGLVAVTVLGVALGNMRLASIEEIRRFKEVVTLMLVSSVFILLAATLKMDQILGLDIRSIAFIVVLLIVIRPLMVAIVSIGTGLTLKEKILIGWIAPRGVVCVAVAGIFAPTMLAYGYEDATQLVPICFGVVFVTVVLHGLSIRFLGKRLDLVAEKENGILIVGASPMAQDLAEVIQSRDLPVMIADNNWRRLRPIRVGNIPTYYGETLSDETEHNLEFNQFSYLLALTDSVAYNALVCAKYVHEFGRDNVAQLARENEDENEGENDPATYSHTLRGKTLVGEQMSFDKFSQKYAKDWKFVSSRLSDTFTYQDYLKQKGENCIPLMAITSYGKVIFHTTDSDYTPMSGDVLIAFIKLEVGGVESKSGVYL
ncbi:MAG: NhaP-type Na+/H+ or K+/H+ antiporter [Alphaproteobacteria bacterium]|jgi:NhaP-type Na+/H+ or K+/H+ antiporter